MSLNSRQPVYPRRPRPRSRTCLAMIAIAISVAVVFTRGVVIAQESPAAAADPFLRWMNQLALQLLQKRESRIAQIRSVDEAEKRKREVRQTLLDILGGLPEDRGPLNARVTGRIDAGSYSIEKIIFESLPHFFVTANLYRPNVPGRYPAVLLQSGHTQEGKAEPQRLAANLAVKGFVALAFDPIGQGEREQTYERQVDGPLAGWSVNEHLHAGAQSILIGQSVARYFVWDGIRALDYLLGRAEVDPTRVGAAGCSGGGALTTFVAALDPRVKAVVPACFPNSYRVLFAGPNPDSEMSWPNFLAKGLDVADFVELSAPTPWLLQATKDDYFTPEGAQLVYEEARHWYHLYAAEEKVRLFIGSGPHGTPLESREAIYEWMIRWLKGGQGEFREVPVRLYANHELQVTASGHVDSETGSRKLYQLILDDYHTKAQPGTIPELLAELRRLGIPSSDAFNTVTKLSGEPKGLRQEIRFESEPGIELRAYLYVPSSSGRKPGILLVADDSTPKLAERLARSGHVVLELEPRNSPQENDRRPFLGNWLVNVRANQIGLVLPALRAHDIVRGVDALVAREDVDPTSIRAAAKGVKGIWLLLAAAVDTRISKIWLDRTPHSLRAALERSINMELFDATIPGFVLRWDLSDLVLAMGDRKVLWTDPTSWMRRSVPLGPPFRYRYVLGDTTDLSDAQDIAYADEWLR